MSTELMVAKPSANVATVRQEFGASEVEQTTVGSTVAQAIAAREQALVQARCIMALQRPRKWFDIRGRMIDECKRKGFAEVARYRKPVGKNKEGAMQYAEGFSIRFAEMAIRHAGNIDLSAVPIYEDDHQRVIMMSAVDIETNASYQKPIVLVKTVERRHLKKGQTPLGERVNSYGDKVYIVEATNDEVNMREAAEWSKFIRNALRFVPGDILDECEEQIQKTLSTEDNLDPNARKYAMVKRFEAVNVGQTDLEAYLGRSLDKPITEAEFKELADIYRTIKAGEGTWQEMLDAKGVPTGTVEDAQKAAAAKLDGLRQPKPAPPAVSGAKITEAQAEELKDTANAMNIGAEGLLRIIAKYGYGTNLLDVSAEHFAAIKRDIEQTPVAADDTQSGLFRGRARK